MKINSRYTDLNRRIWWASSPFYMRLQTYLGTTVTVNKSKFHEKRSYPGSRHIRSYRMWQYPELGYDGRIKKGKIIHHIDRSFSITKIGKVRNRKRIPKERNSFGISRNFKLS